MFLAKDGYGVRRQPRKLSGDAALDFEEEDEE
jgi:hypothetical protein